MTGSEIAAAAPWEINQRINGYIDRMKDKRLFTASFITAPVINSGVRSPKHGVSVRELIPQDFGEPEEREKIKKIIEQEEERRERLKNERTANHGNTGS